MINLTNCSHNILAKCQSQIMRRTFSMLSISFMSSPIVSSIRRLSTCMNQSPLHARWWSAFWATKHLGQKRCPWRDGVLRSGFVEGEEEEKQQKKGCKKQGKIMWFEWLVRRFDMGALAAVSALQQQQPTNSQQGADQTTSTTYVSP